MKKSEFRTFLLFKLPIAWLAGLKLHAISPEKCTINVRLKWLNQNPFKSMFWAVQGMAAELSSGVLLVSKIKKTKVPISMLVVEQKAEFTKKAKGLIHFTCEDGMLMDEKILKAIQTQQGETFQIKSIGTDEQGDIVAKFYFTWSIKVKT